MSTTTIRPLIPNDEDAVVDMVHGPGGTGISPAFNWPEDSLRLEVRFQLGWGVWENGRLLAFVFWRDVATDHEISTLATRPAARRRGLMKELLLALFDAYSQDVWRLEVHEDNRGAFELYRGLGFQKIGRRLRYYQDGGAALVLERIPPLRELG